MEKKGSLNEGRGENHGHHSLGRFSLVVVLSRFRGSAWGKPVWRRALVERSVVQFDLLWPLHLIKCERKIWSTIFYFGITLCFFWIGNTTKEEKEEGPPLEFLLFCLPCFSIIQTSWSILKAHVT